MALSVNDTLRKAERHARKGELDQAAKHYQSVLEAYPGNQRAAEGLRSLNLPGPPQPEVNGLILLLNQKKFDEVFQHAELLAQKYPWSAVLQTLLGAAIAGLGHPDRAIGYYMNAIEIDPKSADAYNNLAAVLLDLGRHREALGTLAKAIDIKPEFAIAHNNMGNALRNLGRPREAIESYETALELAPTYAEAHNNLGITYSQLGMLKEAIESFTSAITIEAGFVVAHNNLGNALREFGRVREAVDCFENALRLAPEFVEAHNNLGNSLSVLGRRDEAVASFHKALELNPDFAGAHRNLSLAKTYVPGDAQIDHMLGLIERDGLSDDDRMQLSFALGKAYEDLGEWDKAFAYFSEANRIAKQAGGYALADDENAFAQLKGWFPEGASAVGGAAEQATTPVFIVGMPRSGTALVEQILASHSDVYGAGELSLLERAVRSGARKEVQDPLSQLASIRETYQAGLADIGISEPYVTDKMPLNFRWIGFICTAMPGARIVHVERDPRATCWSIFKHHFPSHGHGFANDLQDLAGFYKLYRGLMAFWCERFPGRIYDLNYEALTENQEDETRKLLEYVGLEWEDACLEFHKTERAVQTSSSSQVRQAMYRGSSDAWRNYEDHLGPLAESLKDS